MMRTGAFLPAAFAILAALWGAAGPARAFETDQFLALDAELEDSAEAINRYVNDQIEIVLTRTNRRGGSVSCAELPPRIYRRLFRNLLSSRLRKHIETSPEIDRFPADDTSNWRYFRQSIYRRPVFPFYLPLSRVVRIGEVRTGVDKFGHLFGFGRRYYSRYRRHVGAGLTPEEAARRVVRWGIRQERMFVGGWADGIFSYADLEANYQGLELARAFCEGPSPYLVRRADDWTLAEEVDLRRFVNPLFDETFNNNHFVGPRWNRVRPILSARYCDRYRDGELERHWTVYRSEARSSISSEVVADYFSARGSDRQRRHSLAAICDSSDAVSASP